jgi:hypothetical protein
MSTVPRNDPLPGRDPPWSFARIGRTLSRAILAVTYLVIVTPISLLLRLFGHDPMRRRFLPATGSYWLRRRAGRAPSHYFRQF